MCEMCFYLNCFLKKQNKVGGLYVSVQFKSYWKKQQLTNALIVLSRPLVKVTRYWEGLPNCYQK